MNHPRMKMPSRLHCLHPFVCGVLCVFALAAAARASNTEYTGKLNTELVINENDYDQVVLKPMRDMAKSNSRRRLKRAQPLPPDAYIIRRSTNRRSSPCSSNPKTTRLTYSPTSTSTTR